MSVANALKQVRKAHERGLKRLLRYYPTVAELARQLNTTEQVIHGWKSRNRISRKGAEAASKHPELGRAFSLADLRPELEE